MLLLKNYLIISFLLYVSVKSNNYRPSQSLSHADLASFSFNDTADASADPRLSILNQLANLTVGTIGEFQPGLLSSSKETIGNVVFNVHHFTQFLFDGNHVYVYSPKKNDENIQQPQKWTFFYIPILRPVQTAGILPWVTISKLEIRVQVALGTPEVEEVARQAIADQFTPEIADKYAKKWVIAPLMLDSLSAYIVTVGSIPVPGAAPFHVDNPNSNVLTLRFVCPIKEIALIIAIGLLTGDLDIEVSFYFSGMHRVRTNMMTITATQLQSVLSKTIADGGGTNSTYIHRDQASNFVAKYVTNVKKLVYIEDSNANMSVLTSGLEIQLAALFQEAITKAKVMQINAGMFDQVWQSADLNPDRITNEMSKMFTFNKTATEKHNSSENYYSVNQRKDCHLPANTPLDVRIRTIFTAVDINIRDDHQKRNIDEYETTTHDAVSESDIKRAASQASIEGAWEGQKFIPKSFKVFKLIDLVDQIQVGVIAKQLLAEKANGAVIRRLSSSASLSNTFDFFSSVDQDLLSVSLENITVLASLFNESISSSSSSAAAAVATAENENTNTNQSDTQENFLIGEIKLYAGANPPASPWLICDGSALLQSEYPRLFSVLGTKYGQGDDLTTFRLPDLRGRIPLGVDAEQLRVSKATELGNVGGSATHTLTIEQLPTHAHDSGTLENSYDGQHTHNIHDPGHNHGGATSSYAVPSSSFNNFGPYNYLVNGSRQWASYSISMSATQISIHPNGNHTHKLTGLTSSIGQNESFSILPPFQTFYYIIYAD